MTDAMSEAIARLNRKRSPFPDDVHQALLRMERHRAMVHAARRLLAHAFVECFNERRPYCAYPVMKCRCGYEFPAILGKYGCPACEGQFGAAREINHQETTA